MQTCAYCGRENDDDAPNCRECGTPLTAGREVAASPAPDVDNPRGALGQNLIWQGSFWLIAGIAVTVLSFSAAISSPYGGHYVIAYGAIIFGLAQLFRGLTAAGGTDTSAQAQELLDAAAHLESVDRAKAVALYAEIAKKFPGTRESDEAQRNIQTLQSHRE
jgi:hypothetical protein